MAVPVGERFYLRGPDLEDGADFAALAPVLAQQLRDLLKARGFTTFRAAPLTGLVRWQVEIDGVRVIGQYEPQTPLRRGGFWAQAETFATRD